ncbi:hypothetical protein [Sporolactobacillus terrae]|uniref:Uncharacterized protein n=1 Tax=Sporolactobacillus terrae TaxID=269673 RepID=A0A5K7WWF3_9BACL|nr:hypothetical protein [Sporolactobacillus terrae]BBN98039.1 hypothetical protein St703_07440 [Sporolactobacillus terrae]
MTECPECYSDNNRITPLLGARECLENHRQYICGTCGRCICINKDEKRGLQRWNFPFKSLEIAKLYLRTADVTEKTNGGIFEIVNTKGRKSYKIFSSIKNLEDYLNKSKDKICKLKKPVYQREQYVRFPHTQIRRLTQEEVELYLKQRLK